VAAIKLVFRPIVESRSSKRYADWFRAPEIANARSGVYAFRSRGSGQWLYVGSARSGKPGTLAHTVRRHMQKWTSPRCDGSPHCPGVKLKRYAVLVAVLPTPAAKARAVEKAIQRKYTPRFNDPATYGGSPF